MILKKANTDIIQKFKFNPASSGSSPEIKNFPTFTPSFKEPTNDSTTIKENNSILSLRDLGFEDHFLKDKKNLFKTVTFSSLSQKDLINKKWKLLLNVTKTIIRLRSIKIQRLSTEMIDKLEIRKGSNGIPLSSKREKRENTNTQKPLDYITDQIRLFQYIENGFDQYENEIVDILRKNKFINDVNYENQTPIYASCVNGHVKMTKILIDNGADYLKLYDNDKESILDVAVRFNYVSLVKFLLNSCKWPNQYIKRSMKLIDETHSNKAISKLFKEYNKKIKKKDKCFCSCFGM